MKQTKNISFYAAMVLFVVAAALGNCAAMAAPGEKIAELREVSGVALYRTAGAFLWEPAEEGQALGPGDTVKTKAGSTAWIQFSAGGSVKLLPLTEAIIERVESEGMTSYVAGLQAGRGLIKMESSEEDVQIVVKAKQTVFRGREAKVFVEAGSGEESCLDVIDGSVSVALAVEESGTVSVGVKNRVELLQAATGIEPVGLQEVPDDEHIQGHTCFSKKKAVIPQEVAASTQEKEEEYIQVVISSQKALTFTAPEATADTGDKTGDKTADTTGDTTGDTTADTTGDTTAGTTDEGDVSSFQDCVTKPAFSEVTVNNVDVANGGAVTLEYTDCGRMELAFAGLAKTKCGLIKQVTLYVDEREYTVDGLDEWSAIIYFSDPGLHQVIMRTMDSAGGRSADYKFEIEQEKTVEPPSVTIDTVANEQPAPFGGTMYLNRSNLEAGKLVVAGTVITAKCAVKKLEVSTDGGAAWKEGEGMQRWTFGFSPAEGTYEVLARAIDEDGNESAEMMNPVEIEYSPYTDEDLLKMIFDRIMQAYRDRDGDSILDETTTTYTASYDSIEDRNRLDNALNDKFTEQSDVYIRFSGRSYVVSGTSGRVTFDWDANPSTAGYSHTGVFVFVKEFGKWKFLTVEDNNTFLRHTDQAAYLVNMKSSKTEIEADREETATITLEVRDSAYNPVKDGTVVTLSANTGTIDASATTDAGIVSVEYTPGSTPGTATITANCNGKSASVNITLKEDAPPGPPARGIE